MTELAHTAPPTRPLPTQPPQTCSAAARTRRVISVGEIPPPPAEPAPSIQYGSGNGSIDNANNDNGISNSNNKTQREVDLEDRLARVEGALAAVLHELHAQRTTTSSNDDDAPHAPRVVAQHEEEAQRRRRQREQQKNYNHEPPRCGDGDNVNVGGPIATASSSTSDSAAGGEESRPRASLTDDNYNDNHRHRPGGTPTPKSSNVNVPLNTRRSGEQEQHQQQQQQQQQQGSEKQQQRGQNGIWIPVPEKGGRRRRRRRKKKGGDGNNNGGRRPTHRRSDTGDDSRGSTASGGSSASAFSHSSSATSSSSSSGGGGRGTPQSPKSVTLSSPGSPPRTPPLVPQIEQHSGSINGGGCSTSAVSPLSPWPGGAPTPAAPSGGGGRGRSRARPGRGFADDVVPSSSPPPVSPVSPGGGGESSPPGTPPPAVEYRNFSDAHVEELRRRSNSVTNNNPPSDSASASASEVEVAKKKKDDDHDRGEEEGRQSRSPRRRPLRQRENDHHQPQDQLLLQPPPSNSQLRHRRVTTAVVDPSSDVAAKQPPPRTALQVMSQSSKTSPSTNNGRDGSSPPVGSVGVSNVEGAPRQVTLRRPPGLPPRPAPPPSSTHHSASSSSSSSPIRKGAAAVVKSRQQVISPAIAATATTSIGASPVPSKTTTTNAASPALAQPSPSLKPIPSFAHYVKVEMLGNGAEGSPEKDCDRNMEEFLRVPSRLEGLLVFGLLVCTDSFLNILTVLPLKFARNLCGLAWSVLRGRRNAGLRFHRRHLYQLLQGCIIAFVSYVLLQISVGMLYHWIRGQTMLKLYLIMAIVEVFDRLMCSFGQDALDSLYWNTTRRPRHPRMIVSVVVVLVYAVLHSLVLFVHIATLNVAMNSADQALLSLLIGGNFAEIKSTVFKKYNKQNLFNITTADICERFKLVLFMFLILLLNFFQGGNSVAIVRAFLSMSTLVLASEVLSDWIKHSFITKFNHIRSSVYRDYSLIIAGDVTGIGHEGVDLDHTHAVVKRVGMAQIPLVCVSARYLREALRYSYLTYGDAGRMVQGTALIFAALLVVKVVLGMVLTALAARILDRERGRGGAGGDSPPAGPVDPSKKPKRPVV